MVDDPEDMRTCLENALHLNPNNVKAQQGLAWVEQRYGMSTVLLRLDFINQAAAVKLDADLLQPI